MDPIADVIRLLRPRAVFAGGINATRPWAIGFGPFPHVKLGTVVRGQCWIALEAHAPCLLEEGDFYLLASPTRYVMASELDVAPLAAEPLWDAAEHGVVRVGPAGGAETLVRGGMFSFDDPNAALLLDILPPLVHVPARTVLTSPLASLSALLTAEVGCGEVGNTLVLDHLAQIFLVYMLRAQASQVVRPVGWLGALGDGRIGSALRAMHADVARRWTLAELADVARMSRSAFAAAFKTQVGSAPLDYLIKWRMSLARDALRRESRPISDLAFAIGYESESAFSSAFKRVSGVSPKQFREDARRGGGG